jgi:hypothetical protein
MRRSFVLCTAVLCTALLALLLAACAPANTPVPAPAGTAAPATHTPQSQAGEPATAVAQPEATKPAATPDIAQIVKAQPDDWKHGPDGAEVTIIEWGDFQ